MKYELCITLHDSKGNKKVLPTGFPRLEEEMVSCLRDSISYAKMHGFCRVSFDVTIPETDKKVLKQRILDGLDWLQVCPPESLSRSIEYTKKLIEQM